MSLQGRRVAPPRGTVSEELDWLFSRAFGPSSRRWKGDRPVDVFLLDSFIGARELLPRIWSRTDRDLLAEELEPASLQSIEQDYRHAVAIEIRDHEACINLADLARQRQLPLLFLKGMALRLSGYVEAGVRRAADIDVLVPERSARSFHQSLLERGGVAKDLPASDQHLPVIEWSYLKSALRLSSMMIPY